MGKQAIKIERDRKRERLRFGPTRDSLMDGPGMMIKEEIWTPLHKHPLKLTWKGDLEEETVACDGCQEVLSGPIYGCRPCLVFLHKFCTEMPHRIWIPSHHCPLVLGISPVGGFSCSVCGCSEKGLAYSCARCSFSSDLDCARTEENKDLIHFSHPHALKNTIYPIEEVCDLCEQSAARPWYQCRSSSCSFGLHLSCSYVLSSATGTIQHGSHPCSLVLQDPSSYACHVCQEACFGLAFGCSRCGFKLCGLCYLMPVILTSDNNIRFSEFPLTLREINENILGEFNCELCQERCSGPSYVSRRHGVFHESCILLPEQTAPEHAHPHTLHLKPQPYASYCNLCGVKCRQFVYSCDTCGTNMDAKCAFSVPTVDWSNHIHALTVVTVAKNMTYVAQRKEIAGNYLDGHRCKSCNQKLGLLEECPLVCCASCKNYIVHLQCGPLPCKIKHRNHVHPLTLVDYVIDEDSKDFCCHVCEEYRDPYLGVYYCLDCPFIAEVGCVISEVVASLKGQRGNVKLRTVGRKGKCKLIVTDMNAEEDGRVPGKRSLSLQDLLDSIDEVDKVQWRMFVESVGMASNPVDPASKGSATQTPSSFKAGSNFLNAVQSDSILIFFEDYEEEGFIVRGSYFVAETLVPRFENLVSRYGDFGAKSKLNPAVKSLCVLALLDYLQQLRRSSVEDESGTNMQVLQQVGLYLKLAEYAGFDCKFMEDCIDQAGRLRAILRAEKLIAEANLEYEEKLYRISEKRAILDKQEEEAKKRFEEATMSATRTAEDDGIGDAFKWRMKNMGRGFYLK